MTEQVIATENTIVRDDVLNIDRQIIAGQPVPVDLIDAYHAKVGDGATADDPGADARDELTEPDDAPPADYESQGVEDLQVEADRRELEVEGTGANGNVLKKDLVAALEADDSK